jgi:hypothetical protein
MDRPRESPLHGIIASGESPLPLSQTAAKLADAADWRRQEALT